MYRTFIEIRHDGGRREAITVYEGASRRTAVSFYNSLAAAHTAGSAIVSYGWQVVE